MNVRKQSEDLFREAWNLKLPPSPKVVLMSIANGVNEHGLFDRALAYLVEDTGLKEAQVKRLVKGLWCAGLLKQVQAKRGRVPAVYAVNLAAGEPKLSAQNDTITVELTDQNDTIDYTQSDQNDLINGLSDQIDTVQNDLMPSLTDQNEPINPPSYQNDLIGTDQNDTITGSAENRAESLYIYTPDDSSKSKKKDSANAKRDKKPQPFDDVPGDVRKAIIATWLNSLPEKPATNEYEKVTNQNTAADIARAGYGPAEVERYVTAQYQDPFWSGKFMPLAHIARNMPIWLKKPAPKPVENPVNGAPRKLTPGEQLLLDQQRQRERTLRERDFAAEGGTDRAQRATKSARERKESVR